MIIGQPMQSNHTIRAPMVYARAIGKLPWLLAYILLIVLSKSTLGTWLNIESLHVGFLSRGSSCTACLSSTCKLSEECVTSPRHGPTVSARRWEVA